VSLQALREAFRVDRPVHTAPDHGHVSCLLVALFLVSRHLGFSSRRLDPDNARSASRQEEPRQDEGSAQSRALHCVGLWASATQELSLGLEPVFKVSTGPLSMRQIDLEGAHGDLIVTRCPRRLGLGLVEVLCAGCRV
jgi:hypothetical protein